MDPVTLTLLAILLAFAYVLGMHAGPWLQRADRDPAGTIAVWCGVLWGLLVALAGIVLLLVLTSSAPGHYVMEWAYACLPDHDHPGEGPAAVTSAILVGACVLAVVRLVPRLWLAAYRRRRHDAILDLVAEHPAHLPDVRVLDHPLRVLYCLPVRDRPIIATTGALAALDENELTAVLDHERAHLALRHHRVIAFADAVHAAFPWIRTVRLAREELPRLVEMAADDWAAQRHGPTALAAALRRIGATSCPRCALGAADSSPDGVRLARLEATVRMSATRRASLGPGVLAVVIPLAGVIIGFLLLTPTC